MLPKKPTGCCTITMPEHLLLRLLREESSVAAEVLAAEA
jgi:hypothetical protein